MKPAVASCATAAGVLLAVAVAATVGKSAAAPAPALALERTAPLDGLERLQKLDRARLMKRSGVVDYSVEQGEAGLYYTRVKLGNPSKQYYLAFDTGSDLMWVTCSHCTHCPTSRELNFPLEFYNPNTSSTSSKISCSDDRCKDAIKQGHSVCRTSNSQHSQCAYDVVYAGASTSGHYVSDTIHFDTIMGKGDESSASSSASLFFGCSDTRSGDLKTDGIMGFGKNAPSIILQLNSQGVSPMAFSHCLTSYEDGGSILVLGEIAVPGFAFTPLIPSQPRYNLNMKSIVVNGRKIPINSSMFATSNTQGTFVDSGTTLAYLPDAVYDPVIAAIDDAVPKSIHSFSSSGTLCYRSYSSNISLFPRVTLYFEGEVPMTVGPKNYLVLKGYYDNLEQKVLCIGFLRSKYLEGYEHITILGDLVLRDKIVVYDLENMRLGWVNYNCSLLNKTTTIVVSSSLKRHLPSYCNGLIAIGVALFNSNIIPWRQLDSWGRRQK